MESWNKTYFVYNDEILELIQLWKEASPKKKSVIQGKIIDRMGYIICKRINRYKGSNIYDDLLQEGRMGIITAMEKFDISRGRNFFQYSIWHVKNKIRIFLNKQKRRNQKISISNIEEVESPDITFEQMEAKKVLISEIDKLPEIERKIVKMRSGIEDNDGKTYQQIGDVFSLSKQRIEQIYSHAVSKLSKNAQIRNFFDK